MISEGPTLIEALPGPLQEALDRTLGPDEPLRIAVRGVSHEALAATDRRLLLLTEPPGGGTANVQALPLVRVQRVRLVSATGGHQLTIESEDDRTDVAVPVYDQVKYGRVAERLQQLAGSARNLEPEGGTSRSCPKCQTPLPAEAIFCPGCRLQLADVCPQCTRALEAGWKHCPRCGHSALAPGMLECPSCRETVWPTQPFCSSCGASLHARCSRCGGLVMSEWRHCASCGQAVEGAAPERAAVPQARPASGSAAAEELNAAGIQAYGNDQFDEAISLFQRAIVRAPEIASYHTNLGVAYGEKGMDLEAFAAYRRALELDSNQLQARLNIGYLYSERERYEQAREEWERVVAIAPDSEEAQEARDNLNHLEEL